MLVSGLLDGISGHLVRAIQAYIDFFVPLYIYNHVMYLYSY